MNLQESFKQFDGFFFDCDGVLWEENTLLSGAKDLLQTLSQNNKITCFLSNNSTKSLSQYISKFNSLGIPVKQEQVITSSVVTLKYITTVKSYESADIYHL